jgi:hypothetical protein
MLDSKTNELLPFLAGTTISERLVMSNDINSAARASTFGARNELEELTGSHMI